MKFAITLGIVILSTATSVTAGSYIFAANNDIDGISHPTGYNGTGGHYEVKVCVLDASPSAAELAIPVINVVETFNAMEIVTPNLLFGGDNNIPGGQFDAQSVLLHEIGHCTGLGHPNVGVQSGIGSGERNFTASLVGGDTEWDFGAGTDTLPGSADDVRDDDLNLHWFRISNNNPFSIAGTVDGSTYSRDLADLPVSDAFATNADRTVGDTLFGFTDTEAVMQQGQFSDEAQRDFQHDDVASFELAMAGVDRTSGTADDYTFSLAYTNDESECDITVELSADTGFAVCSVGGTFVGGGDIAITTGSVKLNNATAWFFNDVYDVELLFTDGLGD